MEDIRRRMQLSQRQRDAVIYQDDNGVPDPAPLFVMDFETWHAFQPHNFFNYFVDHESVAAVSRWKPVFQRFVLLHPNEEKILTGIMAGVEHDLERVLRTPNVAKRYYEAYVTMSSLVDELDSLVDRDLRPTHRWNHGYVLNEALIVE